MAPRRAHLTSLDPVDPGEGGALPTSVRLFKKGWNRALKGMVEERYLFDDAAAALVMGAWRKWSVDLMMDLEHASVDGTGALRADATDAMSWLGLEVSSDGDLYAVGLRWTPEGSRRVVNRLQRYVSPYFAYDANRRITCVLNVALTSMPATIGAQPLMAASRERRIMTPEQFEKAMAAVKDQDGAAALTILEGLLAVAATGSEGGEASPEGDAAQGAPDASAAGASALGAHVQIPELAELRSAVTAQGAEIARLRADRTIAEHTRRLSAVSTLIDLGAETPATVWSGDPAKGILVARLSAEPIADLESRVAVLSAEITERRGRGPTPPVGGIAALSAADRKIADGITDPKKRESFIALRISRGKSA